MKLNDACPKDSFPMPSTDSCVDAASGFEMLLFLVAYSGYNQILMDPKDEEKTAFVTERGTYCYKVMLFRLKNAGPTYQRMVSKLFEGLLGTFMEAYIDDTVIKSTEFNDHLGHLRTVSERLRQFSVRLNPTHLWGQIRDLLGPHY